MAQFQLLDPDPISTKDPDPGGDLNTDPPGSETLPVPMQHLNLVW